MRLEQYEIEQTYPAKLLATMRLSDSAAAEVRELTLEVDHHAFDFQVGQSIAVILPGPHDELGHPHHIRLYSIADTPYINQDAKPEIRICVKRCQYIDEYSGERYQGIASNYLCDLKVGASITISGPFGLPFKLPEDKNTTLIMVGMGTGIAPFRALVKHIYQDVKDWQGNIYLFHGAHSGLELLYMNEQQDDFAQYYDQDTFNAFQALSHRPHWADPLAMDYALEARADEMLKMVLEDNAYIYIAGREEIGQALDRLFASRVGPEEVWHQLKADLKEQGRWVELIY